LARLGSSVLGVDAVAKSVDIARAHAARDPLVASRAQYRACTAEQLVAEGQRFDLVMSLEVVEHVTDVATFTHVLSQLLRPGGMLVMSTLNRTLRSYALAIVAAEHLLQWVPQGTHSWRRFVTPEELTGTLLKHGLRPQRVAGMAYAPLSNTWSLNGDLSTNYIGSWTFGTLDMPTR
jgi:ubiquinone biosynthesis O-methyltransferase